MADQNLVILSGNLGRDPDIRETKFGKMATFSLASSRNWLDKKSGERKTQTTWSRVVVYNENLATLVEKFLTKGSRVTIHGRLQDKKYTNKDGVEVNSVEVELPKFGGEIFLSPRSESGGGSGDHTSSASSPKPPPTTGGGGDWDDDIPF